MICMPGCKGQNSPPADRVRTADTLRTIDTLRKDTNAIPQPLGFVSDYGGIYTDEQRTLLDSLLHDLEDSTTVQLALFTFTKDMMQNVRIDDYLLNIANSWAIGDRKKNNGILVGICAECRSMRIENGFGIEKILSNNETKKIIETAFFPQFKEGEYYKPRYTTFIPHLALVISLP